MQDNGGKKRIFKSLLKRCLQQLRLNKSAVNKKILIAPVASGGGRRRNIARTHLYPRPNSLPLKQTGKVTPQHRVYSGLTSPSPEV
jgi:hypothetical protein